MGETARAPGYVAPVSELRLFVESGLAADPPAAGLGEETFACDAQLHLAEVALDLAADGWGPSEAGDAAVPADLGRWAAYEVLAATAACAAQEASGAVEVDLALAEETARRVAEFVDGHGLGPVVRSYAAVAAYDDLQAVAFYEPMAEDVFVSGAWHRPWSSAPLQDELLMAAAAGLVRVRPQGPASPSRQIVLTAEGRRTLGAVAGRLEAGGILAERRHRLALTHRNALARAAGPDPAAAGALHQTWAELLAGCGLGPGGRVLLLGVAVGGAALIREAAELVAPTGIVHVVDPAVAVLRLFAHGADGGAPRGLPHARFAPGRFDALPLSDGAVDVCLAPGFLHLGADGAVLAEIRRVVRPGGRLALAVPHAIDPGHALLRGSMEPLLALAARLEVAEPWRIHAPGQAGALLRRHGFLEIDARPGVVPVAAHPHVWAHLLHGGTGTGVLERIPWRARHDLLHDLGARVGRLLDAASLSHLEAPGELILATVP